MERKDAFKELARFAEARARGAAVVMGNGRRLDGTDGFTGLGVDANTFMSHTIKEIIEPKVLRDWTHKDAYAHLGFAFRRNDVDAAIFIIRQGVCSPNQSWRDVEYAAPIPGTDPAKWGWKPCKVEVPAEKPKPAYDALGALKELRASITDCCTMSRLAQTGLDAIIKNMEQGK